MKFRAVLLAVLAHLALAGTLLYFHTRSQYPRPADNLVVEAPLGDVFVKEDKLAPTGGEVPPSEPETSAPAPSAEYPSEAKPAPEVDASEDSGASGLPDGEAAPLGVIEPVYPALSRKMGEEGEASFVLGVDADGSVTNATLEKSSGHSRLDEAAREALLGAHFRPAVSGGMAILSVKRFQVAFRLNSGKREN